MYEDKLPSPVKHNGPKTPSRSKKPTTSGWAEETPKQTLEKKLSKIRLQDSEEDTTAAPKAVTANHIDSTKNSENVDRAAAFKELNADSISKLCLEGVNLRILLKNLVPESQLQEVIIRF